MPWTGLLEPESAPLGNEGPCSRTGWCGSGGRDLPTRRSPALGRGPERRWVSPRCSRTARTTMPSARSAMSLRFPPHQGQVRTSISKVRFRSDRAGGPARASAWEGYLEGERGWAGTMPVTPLGRRRQDPVIRQQMGPGPAARPARTRGQGAPLRGLRGRSPCRPGEPAPGWFHLRSRFLDSRVQGRLCQIWELVGASVSL